MAVGNKQISQNDAFLGLAVFMCSIVDIVTIPILSFLALMFGSGLIGFTALQRGLKSNWLVLVALVPPLLTFFVYGHNHLIDSVLFYILPLFLMSAYKSTKSWSVVSELQTMVVFLVLVCVVVMNPSVIDDMIVNVANQMTQVLQSKIQLSDEYIAIQSFQYVVLLFFVAMFFAFLFMQYIKRVHSQYHKHKIKAVGIIDMSYIYAFSLLAFLAISLIFKDDTIGVIASVLAFSAVMSGGSRLHQLICKLQTKKSPIASAFVMSIYYAMMYVTLPYSALLCVFVAYGYFFNGLLVSQRK